MKKTWDNLKVGDKIYEFDLWKDMFDEYNILDTGINGYIVYRYANNPPDIINAMHIDKIKENFSLTNTEDEKLIAKEKYALHRIKELQELIKYNNEATILAKKDIIALKKEIK